MEGPPRRLLSSFPRACLARARNSGLRKPRARMRGKNRVKQLGHFDRQGSVMMVMDPRRIVKLLRIDPWVGTRDAGAFFVFCRDSLKQNNFTECAKSEKNKIGSRTGAEDFAGRGYLYSRWV